MLRLLHAMSMRRARILSTNPVPLILDEHETDYKESNEDHLNVHHILEIDFATFNYSLLLSHFLQYFTLNMRFANTFFVASAAGAAIASPLSTRADDRFKAGTWWDIILNSDSVTLNQLKKANGTVIDIDLFTHAENGNIKELAKTKTVICYFSAGSREDWRDDADRFQKGDTGSPLIKDEDTGEVWEGENWVNVKSENVRQIMKERIEFAAASGCHAVDPDNVDGYVSSRLYSSREV